MYGIIHQNVCLLAFFQNYKELVLQSVKNDLSNECVYTDESSFRGSPSGSTLFCNVPLTSWFIMLNPKAFVIQK